MAISTNDVLDAFRSDYLDLIILPTEQCNFRCTYCYEDFAIGRMSDGTIKGVKALIDRRLGKLKNLHIGWFGGEPLLALKVIEEICSHVIKNIKPEVCYRSSISTNGALLDARRLGSLTSLGVKKFQISLDGDKESHDLTRRKANGRGSFDKIWSNCIAAHHSNFDFNIAFRIHLTKSNLNSIDPLLLKIRDSFAEDKRFTLYFKAVEALGGANDYQFPFLVNNKSGWLKHFEQQAGELGLTVVNAKTKICYASRANSFVIRADGRIGKCTVALDNDVNDVGYLRSDGTMEITNARFRKWLENLLQGDEKGAHCPFATMQH